MDIVERHGRFLDRLDISQGAVWYLAEWFQGRGYDVQINAARKAPTYEERGQFADNGDLRISLPIEVKHISASFTGADDWPFGSHFIVCSKSSWDRKFPKPFAYVCVNKEKTHAGIVAAETRAHWYVQERTDKAFEQKQDFYFCPLNQVKFVELGGADNVA